MIKAKINELLKHLFKSREFDLLYKMSYNKSIPYQNYIGVNFNKSDVISIKLYFTFFEIPDFNFVKSYLPDTMGYEKYIGFYKSGSERSLLNSGIAFTLKINSSGEIKRGYHFRIDKTYSFPEIKAFKCNNNDLLNIGICQEFDKDMLTKYYYYFDKAYNKEKFAERFDKAHAIKSDLIEYTESEKFNKLITCNLTKNSFYQKFLRYNSPIADEVDHLFVGTYGLDNTVAHGFYENSDIEAKYYFNIKKQNNKENVFLSIENKHIDTISDIFKNFN